jgi:hypothetical protein
LRLQPIIDLSYYIHQILRLLVQLFHVFQLI